MYLGYARVSTIEQGKGTSLLEQERVIKGMAMTQGIGAYDLQLYIDDGISGSVALSQRPRGRELFDAAQKGDTVVAAKLDRLFRDALDAQFVYRSFKERGIDLIVFDMGIEPVTRDGMSKCFFTMLSAFAELERCRIAERCADGIKAKAAKAGYVGGQPPYGYRRVGQGKQARIEPVAAEQEVLGIVGGMGADSTWHVAKKLTERGIFNRNGYPFQHVQIKRIREGNIYAAHQG